MGGTAQKNTIVDIARLAGVSNITVSRAFSKPELVSRETREKIFAIAKQLNYSPNIFARSLKNNDSRIIGVVSDSTRNHTIMVAMQTLFAEADLRGYTVMMFDTHGSEEVEARAMETLFSYKVSAIVLSVVRDDPDYAPAYIRKAHQLNIPIVLFDRDFKKFSLPGVFLNNEEMGIKAGQYLQTRAYERMLIIGGPETSMITRGRVDGMLRTLESDIRVECFYTYYSYEQARPLIVEKLRQLGEKERPQCIVGINGQISLAAIGACRLLGIHRKMEYFSFDEVPYAADFGYSVPCIANDLSAWGRSISEMVFKLIESGNSPLYFDRIQVQAYLKI